MHGRQGFLEFAHVNCRPTSKISYLEQAGRVRSGGMLDKPPAEEIVLVHSMILALSFECALVRRQHFHESFYIIGAILVQKGPSVPSTGGKSSERLSMHVNVLIYRLPPSAESIFHDNTLNSRGLSAHHRIIQSIIWESKSTEGIFRQHMYTSCRADAAIIPLFPSHYVSLLPL